VVEIEGLYQRPTNRSLPHQFIALPDEVLGPLILARMKHAYHLSRDRIGDHHSCGLGEITARTGLGQVIQLVTAAETAWYDMLDMKDGALEFLMHATILTALSCALGHELLAFGSGEAQEIVRPNTCSASPRRSAMVSLPTLDKPLFFHFHQVLRQDVGADRRGKLGDGPPPLGHQHFFSSLDLSQVFTEGSFEFGHRRDFHLFPIQSKYLDYFGHKKPSGSITDARMRSVRTTPGSSSSSASVSRRDYLRADAYDVLARSR
jgi:hypothetical protein